MTNYAKLRERINSSGYKMKYVADECGLTYQGWLKKAKSEAGSEFKASEIRSMVELLKLSAREINEIFLARNVE